MQNFVSFWGDFLPIICEFLLSPPIIWFVGIFVLIFVSGFLARLLNLR